MEDNNPRQVRHPEELAVRVYLIANRCIARSKRGPRRASRPPARSPMRRRMNRIGARERRWGRDAFEVPLLFEEFAKILVTED